MNTKPQHCILIVEDDADVSAMLSTYFKMQGYEVFSAEQGSEALAISAEQQFDLVVLDIRLPDIDGYEVCRQLLTQRQTQKVPIIFMTEKNAQADRLHGLEMGVVDYVTKPFDNQELHLRVRNAIQRAEQAATLNAVTELPETPVLEKRIYDLLDHERDWTAVLFALGGLNTLRERYGFVAADDMLRAVTLMIRNTVRELGEDEDLLSHLSNNEFVVVTRPRNAAAIRSRLETRLRHSLKHFYRAGDAEAGFLTLDVGLLTVQLGQYDTVAAVKQALRETVAPAAAGS